MTSENAPLFSLPHTSPAPARFQHKIAIKEERIGRQTRGPTLSCQSHSMTELFTSHNPLQRAWCYIEHVRHVNAFMLLPHTIVRLPLAYPLKDMNSKQIRIHKNDEIFIQYRDVCFI